MGNIGDLSEFQPTSKINWPVFAKNFDLLIFRVQYGSTHPDAEYGNHVSNAKANGVPFLTYAFPAFISVDDARVEARDARKREDSDSKAIIIDIESEYDSNNNPRGITKLPADVRLQGIQAYVDELRKQGAKKVGGYIAHNVYEAWEINTIISIFDFVWIPRYGSNNGQPQTKPDYPCDLWQYTSVGTLPGYPNSLDLSQLTGTKPLSWFIGGTAAPAPAPSQPAPSVSKYTVQSGDSLWKIAHDHGVTVDQLKAWNHLTSDTIFPGQVFTIGASAPAAPAQPAPSAPSSKFKVVGEIQIVNVAKAAYVVSKPDSSASNEGTVALGTRLPITGSVPGWWEIVFNNQLGYVNEKYAHRTK